MYKVMVACGNGAGSSLMIKLKVEKVMKEMGIQITKMHHCAISEGKSSATQYDVVFCPLNFASMFDRAKDSGVIIIGLKNILSEKEIADKVIEAGLKK